jgi:hypothetical protein
MKDINFLSAGTFVVLPTKSNPKVFLSIENRKTAHLAFNLYNPFSNKAKFLKAVVKFLCFYCNPIAKILLPTIKTNKSDFIAFLEKSLKSASITSSVYMATIKDKVVLQLQADNKVIGYVKYPLNNIGLKNILNEKKAFDILSEKKLIDSYLLFDSYKETPFLILKEIDGEIKRNSSQDINLILDKYKKPKTFLLKEHPRILQLQEALKSNDLQIYLNVLGSVCATPKQVYHEVFEHGDFAPWNLIQSQKKCVPFDFEYFEEEGLEYLDAIKYHFQIEHLLNGKTGFELIDAMSSKVNIKEFMIIFQIFLIKEIINKHETSESYNFESSLLKIIQRAKA